MSLSSTTIGVTTSKAAKIRSLVGVSPPMESTALACAISSIEPHGLGNLQLSPR